MTVIPLLTGSSLLDRVGASRATLNKPPDASMAGGRPSAAAGSLTRATLGRSGDAAAVYSVPRATAGVGRLWSSPAAQGDTISTLMARNRGLSSYNLGDQWRGLGGALLARFGQTGEDYTQTLVDDVVAASGDELDAEMLARQAARLEGVATRAPTAGLKIQTRSGQSVELKISVNAGFDGIVGMKVELKASGAMDAAERVAVAQLADGLDRALEGLGRDDALDLDLSGLMGYDRSAIASVDLTADNSQSHQTLGSFALHLGDDRQSIALKGSDGEMRLNVAAAATLGNMAQRGAAIQRMLDRMATAGERGRANAALVEQMKSAFEQLQSGPAADEGAAQTSGLADFDASLGGETWRRNRFGTTNEAGQVDYQLSQRTETRPAGNGGRAVMQTVSEQLSADVRKAAAPDGMLDVSTGNYAATRVRDRSTVTTLIEAAADGVTRALRKSDVQQLKTVTNFENHRAVRSQSWPLQRSWLERLG